MENEDLVFLSECLGIHLEELKKIDVPQKSIIITSFIDYCSSKTDTPENTELFVRNDTVDQYHYEIHSVEYICQDCGESFSSPDLHRQHELSTHLNIEVKTEFDVTYDDRNLEIKEKLDCTYLLPKESRMEKNTAKCLLGSYKFSEENTVGSYKEGDQYQCDMCHYTSSILEKFNKHLHKHKNKLTLSNKLDQKINKATKLKVKVNSFNKNEFFYCYFCQYKTPVPIRLRNHEKFHLKPKVVICDHCGKWFKLKMSLEKHLTLYHNLESQCDICQQKFVDENDLRLHLKCHRRGKFYHCDLCQYKDISLLKVKDHKIQHMRPECYVCDHCGRPLKSKISLEKHLNLYHMKPHLFTCRQCGQRYQSKTWLKKHSDLCGKKKSEKRSFAGTHKIL
ncbi:PR domain zinc finger protein 5-like [Cotesia glomerata]|uniref:C2H2-type domain-containing protein n=1 Tax=Cotesia glomerata TaxID=32391 RepID=A0AAV7IZF0_COTGL|nr:PR domain zinc finger protein 5-like [Cotesia glomerata]KAH0561304.1 hypothetical protein KQX54_016143 [Cotesia glomerata]